MKIEEFRELNLVRGSIIEYELSPTRLTEKTVNVGYFSELIETLPEHAREDYPFLPNAPLIKVMFPPLNKNYCVRGEIKDISLEEISRIYKIGQSNFIN